MRFGRVCTGLVVLATVLVVWGRSAGAPEMGPPLPAPLHGPEAAVPPGETSKKSPPKTHDGPENTETGPALPPELQPNTLRSDPASTKKSGPVPMSVVGPKRSDEALSGLGLGVSGVPALVPVTAGKVEQTTTSTAVAPPAFRLILPPQPPSLGKPRAADPEKIIQVSKPAALDLPKIAGPALTVEKLTPSTCETGTLAAYELVVRNIGTTPAFQVRVEDLLPPGAQCVGCVPLAEKQPDRVIWDLGRMEAGTEQRCKIEIRPSQPVASWPAALVRFATGPELPPRSPVSPFPPVSAKRVGLGSPKKTPRDRFAEPAAEVKQAALILKAAGPQNAALGQRVVLHIDIHNPGTSPLTDLVLHDHLSPGLDHAQGHEIEANLQAIGPGQSRTIDLPVQAVQAGWQVNQTWITHGDKSLAKARVTVLVGEGGGLRIKQQAPRQAWLDREVGYRIEVLNAGAGAADNVLVRDILPQGLEFVAAGEGGTYDPLTRFLTWKLGSIPAGQTRALTVRFRARTAGDWINRVVAQAQGEKQTSAEARLTVGGQSALVLEVNAKENPVEVGAEAVYEIRVFNRGSQAATGVHVSGIVPAGMEPLTGEGPESFRIQGRQLVFSPLPRLEPGAEAGFRIRVRCQSAGDMHVRVQLTSDQQQMPVSQEESTVVR